MVPTHQCFETDDRLTLGVDHRLVVQREFIAFQPGSDCGENGQIVFTPPEQVLEEFAAEAAMPNAGTNN